jgi:flagellar biogenesis protein FliO
MSSLFGVELPTAVNFVIALAFVLLLIGAAAWLVRRFGVTRTAAAARGRQPRLAVIDSASVDGRRKLVIIRRDNVEHLLMIGGPTDVVVETNIVRGAAAAVREAPPARNGTEAAARPAPLPEPTPWPLQPEPAIAPMHAPAVRAERGPRVAVAEDSWQAPAETPAVHAPPVRAVRHADTLAGLAEELSHPVEEPVAEPMHAAPVIEPVRHAPQPVAATPPNPAADQSLAEMAQRLEGALRRPMAQRAVGEGGGKVSAFVEVKPAREPRVAIVQSKGGAQPKPAPKQAQPQAQPQQGNNLEQEMATLLSRPGKT